MLADVSGPFRTWERLTLVDYALGYYRVGHEYEIAADGLKAKDPKGAAGLYATAVQWYERAHAIDATLVEANAGLKRLRSCPTKRLKPTDQFAVLDRSRHVPPRGRTRAAPR